MIDRKTYDFTLYGSKGIQEKSLGLTPEGGGRKSVISTVHRRVKTPASTQAVLRFWGHSGIQQSSDTSKPTVFLASGKSSFFQHQAVRWALSADCQYLCFPSRGETGNLWRATERQYHPGPATAVQSCGVPATAVQSAAPAFYPPTPAGGFQQQAFVRTAIPSSLLAPLMENGDNILKKENLYKAKPVLDSKIPSWSYVIHSPPTCQT